MGLAMEGRGREEDGEEGGGDEAGLGLIADLFFGALMGGGGPGGNPRPGLAPAAGQANANANGGRGNGNGNGSNIAAARRDPVATPTPTPASVATGSATPVASTGPIRPTGGSVDPLRDYLSATSVRPVVVTRDDDSDGDDEDEDEEETDEEDEDEDEDDEQDRFFGGSHRELIYPDGLPTGLVPLSFVSRPFLHACRVTLYREVNLQTVFQASLFLRTMNAKEEAARLKGGANKGNTHKNIIPSLVRDLKFAHPSELPASISLGESTWSKSFVRALLTLFA
jgi:hypothetical protein